MWGLARIGEQRRAVVNPSSITNPSRAVHDVQADRTADSRVGNLVVREGEKYPVIER